MSPETTAFLEVIRPCAAPGRLRHAVFDFDGTLALLRAGWQGVMADLFRAELRPLVPPEVLEAMLAEPIDGMAGRPTLEQMRWLSAALARLGGNPLTPEAYLGRFRQRLDALIEQRHMTIESGQALPSAWCVPGAPDFLRDLRQRGVTCYIASGTAEPRVQLEAGWLDLAQHCALIWGAEAGHEPEAKRALLAHLEARYQPGPGEVAVFGDGAPEIAGARATGAAAIGVVSQELEGPALSARKRPYLLSAGADALVPDFSQALELVKYFWPQG
jgi:phosphoglycolate phosphatase